MILPRRGVYNSGRRSFFIILKERGDFMKRSSVIIAVLLLAVFVAKPLAAEGAFDWGVKGGLSLSKNTWSNGPTSGTLPKPVVGAFLSFSLSKTLAIQPEVYLLMAGGRDEGEIDGVSWRYDNIQTFIHVPVLAKVRLMREGKWTPIVFAGPAANFLLTAKNKYYEDGELIFEFTEEQIREEFGIKNLTFSLVLGGGAEWMINDKMILVFDIRYSLMLTKLNGVAFEEGSWKNNALMFMLGVGF